MSAPSPLGRVWHTACCLLLLLASVHTLAACSAQQPPVRSSYQRQAEMEDAAVRAVSADPPEAQPGDSEESAEASPTNGGTADVMGEIGVALMSILVALGNVILPFLMLL